MPTPDSEQYTELDLRGTLVTLADRDDPDLDAVCARMATARDTDLAAPGEVIEIGPPASVER